jgi:GNAT superfamily N-acetyltransferase
VLLAKDAAQAGRQPIIGLACLSLISTLFEETGRIGQIFVSKPYRSQGVASKLACRLMERGLAMGLRRVRSLAETKTGDLPRVRRLSSIRDLKPPDKNTPKVPGAL